VAQRLRMTVVTLIAIGMLTPTNMRQKAAVRKVHPASDSLLPSGDSTMYAPICSDCILLEAIGREELNRRD
jgi:hypothetical protein